MAERWLASKDPAAAKALAATMNAHPATAQETAAEFLDAGLWQDGIDTLLQMTAAVPDKSRIHPMVYYYLGYLAGKLGQVEKASEYCRLAAAMPVDYVFPFQNEAIAVLRQAIRTNPRDAHAPYYLGNLLYDWQPEEAAKQWEASEALEPGFAIVHRNLATAYLHQQAGGDLDKAITELDRAVAQDRKYALHFTELDQLYEQAGTPIEQRLALFERNQATVERRDDSQNRAIGLKVAAGKYDDAIAMMTGRRFAVAEGANLNVAGHWEDAHILRARRNLAAGRRQEALADLRAAVTIPSNLPNGSGLASRSAEIDYWTGVAYEGSGDHAKAAESWNQGSAPAASGGRRGGAAGGSAGAQSYYQGLCLEKLGRTSQAQTLFCNLVDSGHRLLRQPDAGGGSAAPQSPRARLANAHYLTGLGYLGLHDLEKARAELSQAVQASPDLLGAKTALDAMQ